MVKQLNIYNVLGCINDPVFIELTKLDNPGVEKVQIKDIVVSKNANGLYEMASPDYHDCAKDIEGCYSKMMEYTKPANVV